MYAMNGARNSPTQAYISNNSPYKARGRHDSNPNAMKNLNYLQNYS